MSSGLSIFATDSALGLRDAAGWLKKYGDERELQIKALNAIAGTKQALEKKLQGAMSQHQNRVMSRSNFDNIMRVKPNPKGWPNNARLVPFTGREDQLKHGPNMGYMVLPQEQIDQEIAQEKCPDTATHIKQYKLALTE